MAEKDMRALLEERVSMRVFCRTQTRNWIHGSSVLWSTSWIAALVLEIGEGDVELIFSNEVSLRSSQHWRHLDQETF